LGVGSGGWESEKLIDEEHLRENLVVDTAKRICEKLELKGIGKEEEQVLQHL
jgi:hypothetical protein